MNPKALGESESISMKECWREGVPVIAGNRFGQRDYMKFFPELAASSAKSVARNLSRIQSNPTELASLSTRARGLYQELVLRGEKSRIAWNAIVDAASKSENLNQEFGLEIGSVSHKDKFVVQVDRIRLFTHVTLSKVALYLRKLRKNV